MDTGLAFRQGAGDAWEIVFALPVIVAMTWSVAKSRQVVRARPGLVPSIAGRGVEPELEGRLIYLR
jgi:hypothetical protein